ncbi:hypothetical protein B484DRAFT_403189 [Ochromonadaceae sp. CCMP2298]|nr:hypothetical protein B484DRAFT_403189 [Ochromonadaceae sp. CCMP2298]
MLLLVLLVLVLGTCWSFPASRVGTVNRVAHRANRAGRADRMASTTVTLASLALGVDVLPLTMEQLSVAMQGSGRAKIVWALLREGRDPLGNGDDGDGDVGIGDGDGVAGSGVNVGGGEGGDAQGQLHSILHARDLIPATIESESKQS